MTDASQPDGPFPLSYCAGGWETLRRLRRLYEDRAADQVCAVFDFPTAALERFGRAHPAGFCEYPDLAERARFWDEHLAERGRAGDDFLPAAYLGECDQGLYGGLLGGEVRFLSDPGTGWISSMVPPLYAELSEAEPLTFQPGGTWWRRWTEQLDVFGRAGAGKFGISHLILIDSLNFVFELVGATKTYLAVLDDPRRVRRAVEFAFDLNVQVHEEFFRRVGLVAGGTCSNMIGWGRGRIVSESVDPFHMMSVADFEAWGRGPVERMFDHFDGGVLHIHGNGRHLLEAVAGIPSLRGIYLGDDKGYPPAFSVLAELKRRCGGVPLVVGVGYERFVGALDRGELLGGVQYVVGGVPGLDAARRQMDRLRDFRP